MRDTAPKLWEAERSDAGIPCSVRDTTRRRDMNGVDGMDSMDGMNDMDGVGGANGMDRMA